MEFELYKFIHSFILLVIIIFIMIMIIIIIIIIIIINCRIVKDRKNPFLAIFRQGCLQFYDSIFGQTIFRSSDWTAKNQL